MAGVREGSTERAPVQWALGAIITVGIVGGVILRFVTTSDLWLDEALSVNIARLPLGDIPEALRRDGAPPLYYVLLHFWMEGFGEGDAAVRALSGLFAVATLPALYFAGRRIGGSLAAWTAVVVLATSPFAIRYATETRMYALVMFLVAWGLVALVRALDRPTVGRLAVVTVITAALLYSHNWSFYFVAVVGGFVLALAWKGRTPEVRRAGTRTALAMVLGGLAYLPWVPVLRDQLATTGTPWADPRLPWSGLMDVFDGLGGVTSPLHGEALFLRSVFIVLLFLGVFAAGIDARRIELDLHTRPTVRWEAFVAFATLGLGLTLSWVVGTAFVARYSAIVVPLLLLVVAAGLVAFLGGWVRVLVLGAVVALGLAGGVRNVVDNRTQAGQVADVIAAEARPGDVVLYCPDQLGPAVSRLLPEDLRLEQVTFPDLRGPRFVDWVDYRENIAATDPDDVAAAVVDQAGDATIWYVVSPGYRSVEGKCEQLGAALGASRPGAAARVAPEETSYFEFMGLTQFPG